MPRLVLSCLLLLTLAVPALAEPKLEEVLTISTGLMKPESAYWDADEKVLYVSNIGNDFNKKDGSGYLSKYTIDGKLIELKWVTGLNAPKGIRTYKNMLYVTALDEIIGIDKTTGKVVKTIPVEGAKFLNDIAVDAGGTWYISDTNVGRIYTMSPEGKVTIFADGAETQFPNGILVDGDKLIVGGWAKEQTADGKVTVNGQLHAYDLKSKMQSFITKDPLGNLDGIEVDGKGGYTVTDWLNGKVFHVKSDGTATTLLSLPQGTADHAYVVEKKLLVLPRMMEDKMTFYTLKD
jgi:sugar lactone lactonase YvrE